MHHLMPTTGYKSTYGEVLNVVENAIQRALNLAFQEPVEWNKYQENIRMC